MRSFLKLFIQLLLVLLALNFLLLFLIRNYGTSRFEDYYRQLKNIDKSHYSIVVTGDSHANDCWRYFESDSILDLSFPGDNYDDILMKIKYLSRAGISYDYHLLEIDPQVFSSYRKSTNNNDLSAGLELGTVGLWFNMNLPLFFNPRIETEIMSIFKPTSESENKIDLGQEISESDMRERAEVQFLGQTFSDYLYTAFQEAIQILETDKVKPIFVHYPFYEPYLSMVNTSDIYTSATAKINTQASAESIQQLKFSQLVCDKQYFYNQDHVNALGSKIVTSYVLECIRKEESCAQKCVDEN